MGTNPNFIERDGEILPHHGAGHGNEPYYPGADTEPADSFYADLAPTDPNALAPMPAILRDIADEARKTRPDGATDKAAQGAVVIHLAQRGHFK